MAKGYEPSDWAWDVLNAHIGLRAVRGELALDHALVANDCQIAFFTETINNTKGADLRVGRLVMRRPSTLPAISAQSKSEIKRLFAPRGSQHDLSPADADWPASEFKALLTTLSASLSRWQHAPVLSYHRDGQYAWLIADHVTHFWDAGLTQKSPKQLQLAARIGIQRMSALKAVY